MPQKTSSKTPSKGSQNKSLGRGLSAFLNGLEMPVEIAKDSQEESEQLEQNNAEPKEEKTPDNEKDNSDLKSHSGTEVIRINVEDIVANPYQPRKKFDEEALKSLAKSIKQKGVLQPILVVKVSDADSSSASQKYQLVAGERRFRATKLAELSEIPAIVTDMGQREQLEIAILENIQREDLNPIEEAEAYKRLMDEFSYTQEALSEVLGKSRSHIANILRILGLPPEVRDMLQNKTLSFGHGRALVGMENAFELAQRIVEQSMTVRETEDFVKSLKEVKQAMQQQSSKATDDSPSFPYTPNRGDSANIQPQPSYIDPELLNVANKISSMLGLQVSIKMKGKSDPKGGTVEIFFKNFVELDRLMEKINGQQNEQQ